MTGGALLQANVGIVATMDAAPALFKKVLLPAFILSYCLFL